MARTNIKPLVIMCHDDDIYTSEALKKFMDKGHTVVQDGFSDDVDVEIGHKCWRIDPRLRLGSDSTDEESLQRQLEMMEKGVRGIKFPKEKKDGASQKI